jgi:MFS family permease
VRRFHLSYANAALLFGAINGLTTGIGFVLGGVLSDFLTGRDKRFYGIVPAVGLILAAPLFALGFLQADWRFAGPLLALGGMCSSTFFAPTYAVAHNIVTARMRASITAIVSLGSSLTALAIGPTLAGYVSDRFSGFRFGGDFAVLCPGGHAPIGAAAKLLGECAQAGALGTRDALVLFSLFFVWPAIHYLAASKTMRTDMPASAAASSPG